MSASPEHAFGIELFVVLGQSEYTDIRDSLGEVPDESEAAPPLKRKGRNYEVRSSRPVPIDGVPGLIRIRGTSRSTHAELAFEDLTDPTTKEYARINVISMNHFELFSTLMDRTLMGEKQPILCSGDHSVKGDRDIHMDDLLQNILIPSEHFLSNLTLMW